MFFLVDSSNAGYRSILANQEELAGSIYLPIISRAELITLNPNAACASLHGEYAIYEAENGTRTDNVQIWEDSDASNSFYLHIPQSATNRKTFISMCFDVTTANWYTLNASVADNRAWSVEVNSDRFDWSPTVSDRFESAEITKDGAPYRVFWEPGEYT